MPWVYKGVSFFKIGELARTSQWALIDSILDDFVGFNIIRGWDYVTWPGTGWNSPGVGVWLDVLSHLKSRGLRLELTLLTDDDSARLTPARQLVESLAASLPVNLQYEIGNEPREHKHIDVEALHAVCNESGLPYASGNNAVDESFFGKYLTHHSSRDGEWQRKGGHDLHEFYTGDGPEEPHAPWHVPAVSDEPMKPVDPDPGKISAIKTAGGNWDRAVQDYKAYFATCAMYGGGATFHYEGGKFGQRPATEELRCAKGALEGLNFCTPGTPNNPPGPHTLDEAGENSLRTYQCGGYMVRVPPLMTKEAPEPGWVPLDEDGILWRR